MSLIDLILNLAGVLLWMDWRSSRTGKIQSALSIASAVRPADRSLGQGYGSLAFLLAILLLRPLFYYSIGPSVSWTPTLDFLAVSIPWRSDLLGRMSLFSTVSFALALGMYYAWLLLLSAVNHKEPDTDLMDRFVRGQLGWLEKVPWFLKLLIPSVVAGLGWFGLGTLLLEMELIPTVRNPNALWGQAGGFALAAFLTWKWLLVVLFLVHLLHIYVYLGTHPIFPYISRTSRKILFPFSFLRFGKIDLAPVAGIAAVIAVADLLLKPAVIKILQRFLT
jgi:hypothetical protein